MSNPFEAPKTPGPLAESGGPPRVPISAYVLAVISALFVAAGFTGFLLFSPILVGPVFYTLPPAVRAALFVLGPVLGIVSAVQSIRQARRKAEASRRSV